MDLVAWHRARLAGARARSRMFTLCAIASLAVGVGANTATFSVVDAVLIEPLPYPEADRLTIVWNEFTTAGESRFPLAGLDIAELAEEPGLFESIGGVWATSVTVGSTDGGPLQVFLVQLAASVSPAVRATRADPLSAMRD
jgi:hypothetical protein